MYCNNCGKELKDNAKFCSGCGANTNGNGTAQTDRGIGEVQYKYVVDTNRSLIKYILFSILTCGIYSLYFMYKLAVDVNAICEGDGKQTPELLELVLLTIVTCGIYTWIWEYTIGNRLADNGPRYGLQFNENGTTILMWRIFGILLFGAGPLIAMNIIINNTNALADAYNARHKM